MRKFPEWVIKKPVVLDLEYMTSDTMNRNDKK